MKGLLFTEGFGNAGRLYERLRKRSLRGLGGRKRVRYFIGKRAAGGDSAWMLMDHQAYVRGLRDGIKGAMDLAKTGDLY